MLHRILFLLLLTVGIAARAGDAPGPVIVLTGGALSASATENSVRAGGYGRELISKLMADAGQSYAFEPQPFARALKTLEATPNAVLFPLLRTPDREARYQWIGMLAKRNYYLYRLDSRKDIVIKSLDDARAYRIGVLRGDVRTDYLRAQGFTEGTHKGLDVANVAVSLLKMQQAGRIDLIVFSDEGVKLACEEAKVSCDSWVPAFRLDMASNLWLAASPQMPPALFNSLRKSFQRQEDSGYVGKLMKSGRPVGG